MAFSVRGWVKGSQINVDLLGEGGVPHTARFSGLLFEGWLAWDRSGTAGSDRKYVTEKWLTLELEGRSVSCFLGFGAEA